MIQFDRYRVLEYDEALRLWCEDHYHDLGWELRTWSDCEPVSVREIMAICAAHELAEHSSADGHPPSGAIPEGDHPQS